MRATAFRNRIVGALAAMTALLGITLACAGQDGNGFPGILSVTDTPLPPLATFTPTPEPALSPERIWIGVEGRGRLILEIEGGGLVTPVNLPLNEGQQASNIVASADASTLAYIVWDENDMQRGIATWKLSEANAQLTAQALPGYRIVDLQLAPDGNSLAYLLAEQGVLPRMADWRIEMVSQMGDEPVLLLERAALEAVALPEFIGWQTEGRALWINTLSAEGKAMGVYGINPARQETKRLVPPADQTLADTVMEGAQLSPDYLYLAYLAYDPNLPGAAGERAATNVARIVNLSSNEVMTMIPPADHAVYGVRWYPDSQHLLFDLVHFAAEGDARVTQVWAWATIGQALPWESSTAGPDREYLFTYETYGAGVVFTILPADANWQLYLLENFSGETAIQTIPLSLLVNEGGTPAIIHVP